MRDLGFAEDLSAMLALRDARARENAERRAAARANVKLCAALLADAERRGLREVDWIDYFQQIDANYP